MGNICCQIDTEKSFIDDDTLRRDHYQQTNLPTNDEVLTDWLKSSHIQIENQGPIKAMKDIQKERYYYGEWKDGLPEGKGLFYEPSKLLFNGVFQNGVPTGPAKIKFIDSLSEFEGQLKQGRANGHGTIDNLKQKYKFQGEWENSRPKKGTLTFATDPNISHVQFQDFSQRKAVINYKDTRRYEGEVNTSKLVPDGKGIVNFPPHGTKVYYDGEWHNGQMHGKGKFQWSDGSWYDGQFIHGKKQGLGKFGFSNGNIYEGYWIAGKQEGTGTLFNKNNEQLKKGIWKGGVFMSPLISTDDWQRQSQVSANKRDKVLQEVQSQIKEEKQRQLQQASASKIVKKEQSTVKSELKQIKEESPLKSELKQVKEENAVESGLKQIKEDPIAQNNIVSHSEVKKEHTEEKKVEAEH